MNRKEVMQLLAILKAAYPNGYKLTPEEATGTVGVWCVHFKDIPADIVMMAVNKHISSNAFPPYICEIKQKISVLYMEAYEIMANRSRWIALLPQEKKQIERIYNITESYSCGNNSAELSLHEMLSDGLFMIGGDKT